MTTPTFANPELQKAIKETSDVLDGSLADIDQISQDITALEKYLQSKAVTIHYIYDSPANGSVEGNEMNDFLDWNKDENSGKFRLMYVSYDEEDARPLIETSVEVRRRMAPFLPSFVRGIAKAMKSKQK